MIDSREPASATPQEHLEAIEKVLARHRVVEDLAHRQAESDGRKHEPAESLVHRQNLSDLHQVAVLADRVDRALAADLVGSRDLVVLDPPRTGARRDVVEGIVALAPRAVAYVACDPAALARDVAIFAEHGYPLTSLRAFDLFPMTHHVKCVAVLSRRPAGD